MAHPEDKVKIELKNQFENKSIKRIAPPITKTAPPTLEQLTLAVKQALVKPVVDGSAHMVVNGYFAHLQLQNISIRRRIEQQLTLILQPLNVLTSQTICRFSATQVNTIGARLSHFKQNLEIDIHAFFINSLVQTRVKLETLISSEKTLKSEKLVAFRNLFSYMALLEDELKTSFNCRIKRAFKFHTPTEDRSLITQKAKAAKSKAINSKSGLQPAHLNFASDNTADNAPQTVAAGTSFSKEYFERKHAHDRVTFHAVTTRSPNKTAAAGTTPIKSPKRVGISMTHSKPGTTVHTSPIKRIQDNTVVVSLNDNVAAAPMAISPKKKTPVKISPKKSLVVSTEIDSKMVMELKEKSDEIRKLHEEINRLCAEISKAEDTLSKISQARTKDQIELQTYSVREVEFLNRDLAEKIKNMELNKKILQLEKRVRELEHPLTVQAQNSNNNQAQPAQTQQPQPSGSQVSKIVIFNNQQTFNYVSAASTVNVNTNKEAAPQQNFGDNQQVVRRSASPQKTCSYL